RAVAAASILRELNNWAVAPELLKRVELTVFCMLDVDNNVAEVDQDPASGSLALTAQDHCTGLEHGLFNGVNDCADLALVVTGRNEEHVRQNELFAYINSNDLCSFTLRGCAGSGNCKFNRVVSSSHVTP